MKHIVTNLKLFIVLGLLALALGCDSGKKSTPNTGAGSNNTSTQAQTPNPASAPIGAQPPNMLGGPTASVTIEEFADFQCGACAQVHSLMKNVQSAYGSRIKFIYRHYPLTQIHKNAYDAAVASEAAGMQGKFWDMQNQLFTNQVAWSNVSDARTMFESYAQKIGLDVERFKADMAGMAAKQRVDADMQRGRALNISSTPTLYINGVSVPFEQMKLETIRQIIDEQLQKAPATTPQTSTAPANSAASNSNKPATNSAVNSNTTKSGGLPNNKPFSDQ